MTSPTAPLDTGPGREGLPLRLRPGDDLRAAVVAALAARGLRAAFVVAGIGSLGPARLRLAGRPEATTLDGEFEILTLAGTVAMNGAHLHAALADADGRVIGGHVAPGCIVRTTAELLLAPLPGWVFTREPDAATGCEELVMRPAQR